MGARLSLGRGCPADHKLLDPPQDALPSCRPVEPHFPDLTMSGPYPHRAPALTVRQAVRLEQLQ